MNKGLIFIVFLLCVPSVLADVISPIIDGRATIWGQRQGHSVMRIQGEGTSYNCNVTIYDSGLVQRYFAFMQMPQSNNWSFNDLDFGVSSPCSNFTGPCTSSGGGYITWTSPDIPFYNAYRPRYDVENMTYAVSCVRLSWPYTLTEENFTFPLYNYYRVRVDPVNVTWGDDYNLSFSVAQFITDGGSGPLGIAYNFTLYLYGGAVSIYNYSKIIGIDYQSSSNMEWTNSTQSPSGPLQVSFGLNSSEVDWNDLSNEDYYYTVKASLVSLMQDAVDEGDYTYASDHLVMSNDTSWIVLSQGEVCGNGIIEGAEVCDGFNVSGLTCADYNYTGGTLVCNDLCSDYNVSVCYNLNYTWSNVFEDDCSYPIEVNWTYVDITNQAHEPGFQNLDINHFDDDSIAVVYRENTNFTAAYFVCDSRGQNCTAPFSASGDHNGIEPSLVHTLDDRMIVLFRDYSDLNYPHGAVCYKNGTCDPHVRLYEAQAGSFHVRGSILSDNNILIAWDQQSYYAQLGAVFNSTTLTRISNLYSVCLEGRTTQTAGLFFGNNVKTINNDDVMFSCSHHAAPGYSNYAHWNGTALVDFEYRDLFWATNYLGGAAGNLFQLSDGTLAIANAQYGGAYFCASDANDCKVISDTSKEIFDVKQLESGIVAVLDSYNVTLLDPAGGSCDIIIPVGDDLFNYAFTQLSDGSLAIVTLNATGFLGLAIADISVAEGIFVDVPNNKIVGELGNTILFNSMNESLNIVFRGNLLLQDNLVMDMARNGSMGALNILVYDNYILPGTLEIKARAVSSDGLPNIAFINNEIGTDKIIYPLYSDSFTSGNIIVFENNSYDVPVLELYPALSSPLASKYNFYLSDWYSEEPFLNTDRRDVVMNNSKILAGECDSNRTLIGDGLISANTYQGALSNSTLIDFYFRDSIYDYGSGNYINNTILYVNQTDITLLNTTVVPNERSEIFAPIEISVINEFSDVINGTLSLNNNGTLKNSSSCEFVDDAGFCYVNLDFYDPYGIYSYDSISVSDRFGATPEYETFGGLDYYGLIATIRSRDFVTFSGQIVGYENIQCDVPIKIINSGNVYLSNLTLTAHDLIGSTDPTKKLYANYFRAGKTLSESVQLQNGVPVRLNMDLAVGGSAYKDLYIWVSVPANATPQYYSPENAWTLTMIP